MKTEAKKRTFSFRPKRRSTASLLASGVATITFDASNYTVYVDTPDAALKRDREAIRGDAKRAFYRLRYAEPA